jgi:hypothetical protein
LCPDEARRRSAAILRPQVFMLAQASIRCRRPAVLRSRRRLNPSDLQIANSRAWSLARVGRASEVLESLDHEGRPGVTVSRYGQVEEHTLARRTRAPLDGIRKGGLPEGRSIRSAFSAHPLLLRVLGRLPLKAGATHSGGRRPRSLRGGNRGTCSLGGAGRYGDSGAGCCVVVGADGQVRTA